MRKINIALIAVTVVLIILNVVQFFVWKGVNKESAASYTEKITQLESSLAAYGTNVTCYTVVNNAKAGDIIKDENLEAMTIPSNSVTSQHVTDKSSIVGRVFKIAVNPGTPITSNMTMAEVIEDDMRDRDILLDRITVGIKEGDYIDIRITMPYGDDYVVIPHKRVYGLNGDTIKLYLTEFEWFQYNGAMIDYYLNREYGATIYADKYIEPGLQQDAVAYYAVPTNIAALMQKNPNIIDKKEASNLNQWRNSIEELLVIFRDEEDTVDADGGRLAEGRSEFNESVNSARQDAAENDTGESTDTESDTYEDEITDDFWEDVETAEDTVEDMATEGE